VKGSHKIYNWIQVACPLFLISVDTKA